MPNLQEYLTIRQAAAYVGVAPNTLRNWGRDGKIKERRNPQILNGSRKKRIAIGSGNSVQAVNQLLKQFEMMKKMFSSMSKGKPGGIPRGMAPFLK